MINKNRSNMKKIIDKLWMKYVATEKERIIIFEERIKQKTTMICCCSEGDACSDCNKYSYWYLYSCKKRRDKQ